MRSMFYMAAVVAGVALAGCATPFGPQAKNGITFYCPGVGNVDMGDAGLREGLQKAGYRGEVSRLTWSYTFNPLVDQTVQPIARLGAARLAGYIQDYIDQYPGRDVNVVGLSAGSGVAIWALEALRPEYKVHNVVLLSGSLSSDYDAGGALQHVRGEIYNYYSPHDAVLTQLMKVACTIDGKIAADGAGAVGLHSPHGAERVVNIEWRTEFERYGYCGGHGDSTSPAFVQEYISRHIVMVRPVAPRRTTAASLVATAPPDGHPD